MSQGLPPIDQSLVPASIRKAGPAAVQKYDTALSFEELFDEQLAQALTQSIQDTSSSDDSGDTADTSDDAATSLTMQMLPQSLAQGVVASGGTGLAQQIYDSLGGTTR
jgi:Rod binding domain-containing protein